MQQLRALSGALQQVAAHTGVQASRHSLAKAVAWSGMKNTTLQTGAETGLKTAGIAFDTSLTSKEKVQKIKQNTVQTARQFPEQLITGGISSYAGVATQLRNVPANVLDQFTMDAATNLAQTSIGNNMAGNGFGVSRADIAAAGVNAVGGALQNIAGQRPLQKSSASAGAPGQQRHSGGDTHTNAAGGSSPQKTNTAAKPVTTAHRLDALGSAVKNFNKQPSPEGVAKVKNAHQDLNDHRDRMRDKGEWNKNDEAAYKNKLKQANPGWIAGNYQADVTPPSVNPPEKSTGNSKKNAPLQANPGVDNKNRNTVADGAAKPPGRSKQRLLAPSNNETKLIRGPDGKVIATTYVANNGARTHTRGANNTVSFVGRPDRNVAMQSNAKKPTAGNEGTGGHVWKPEKVKANWAIVGRMGGVKALSDGNLDKLDYLTKKIFLDTNLSPTDRADFAAKLSITTAEKARRVALIPTEPATGLGPNRKQISLSDSSGLHPYVGNAMSKIPVHKTGTTVIIGAYTPDMLKPGSNRVAHIDNNFMGTGEVWNTNWRDRVPEGAGGPLHIYRTFEDPMTGKRMVMKVDPDKPHTPNIQDKNMLDVLLKIAGVDINVPLAKIVDEVPSNTMHNNPPLWVTHSSMGKVALVGAKLADARKAANIDGMRTWTMQEQLARTGLDVVEKSFGVTSSKENTLPAQWMLHYFKGSGKPKVLDQDQMEILQKAYYLHHPDYITLGKALNAKIRQERDAGRTSGHMEIYLEHDISGESVLAPEEAGLYNTLGGYHPGTVYKIDWTLTSDNVVKATGNKTFIAQDRYNWEVSEFNKNTKTKTIPKIPSIVLKAILPDSVLNKFGAAEFGASSVPDIRLNTVKSQIFLDVPYKDNFVGVTDAMLGRLQMGKGGAQAFTTMGITEVPIKVDSYWDVND